MKTFLKWLLLGVAFFVLAFCVALPFFSGLFFRPMGWMMTNGFSRFGMMNGGMFGGLGMLIPLAFLFLFGVGLIALVAWLVRKPTVPSATTPCPSCNKPLQPEWTTCPFCGQKK